MIGALLTTKFELPSTPSRASVSIGSVAVVPAEITYSSLKLINSEMRLPVSTKPAAESFGRDLLSRSIANLLSSFNTRNWPLILSLSLSYSVRRSSTLSAATSRVASNPAC